MIIARSPLRITLGGGGTDLPSYYREHTGFLVAAAIDKYVYINLHRTFTRQLIVKYSKYEQVSEPWELEHPIVREALIMLGMKDLSLEIASMADIPAGTGLGSSGSFTTALLTALHAHLGDIVSTRKLAEEACTIEIDRLNEPSGKQDQYISAYGGLTCFTFNPDGTVGVSPLAISQQTFYNLEEGLCLFFTGFERASSKILGEQKRESECGNAQMIDNLHFVKQMGLDSKDALERGDLHQFAELMNVHWMHKKKRSNGMSNPKIDEWYEYAIKNGALGGKLIGAGGGGFLMFFSEQKPLLRAAMARIGLSEVHFRFEMQGAKTI